MPYETKPGQGSLFVADKGDNEKRPDRRGKLVCPCCEGGLKLSGWIKTSEKGTVWLSMKAEQDPEGPAPRPLAAPVAIASQTPTTTPPQTFNDDIPF